MNSSDADERLKLELVKLDLENKVLRQQVAQQIALLDAYIDMLGKLRLQIAAMQQQNFFDALLQKFAAMQHNFCSNASKLCAFLLP